MRTVQYPAAPASSGADQHRASHGLRVERGGEETRCRCGTHLRAGTERFGFDHPPVAVRELLVDVAFCSPVCARAYLLEALELFAGASAGSVVEDREEVLAAFSWLYAALFPVAS